MKEIELDKIINEKSMHEFWMPDDRDEIRICMKEAIRQALEIASEEAKIIESKEANQFERYLYVDKNSITSIINRVK